MLIRVGFAVLVTAIYIAYMLIATGGDASQLLEISNLVLHGITMALVVIFLATPSIGAFLTALKLWKDPSMHLQYSGAFSSAGILYTGNKAAIPWTRYAKKQIKPDLVVLLTAKGVLSFFPRRFFKTEEEWQQAVQLVVSHF